MNLNQECAKKIIKIIIEHSKITESKEVIDGCIYIHDMNMSSVYLEDILNSGIGFKREDILAILHIFDKTDIIELCSSKESYYTHLRIKPRFYEMLVKELL